MQSLELIHGSCVEQDVDAVVNAANGFLAAGTGICGVIFDKAGEDELTEACDKIDKPVEDGQAVITPSFGIKNVKAIIHAVGPDFGFTPEAFDKLFDAYYNSLSVLKENGYHSIAFPLISAGVFGIGLDNPVAVSTEHCVKAYKQFVKDNPDYELKVILCAYTAHEYESANPEFEKDYED